MLMLIFVRHQKPGTAVGEFGRYVKYRGGFSGTDVVAPRIEMTSPIITAFRVAVAAGPALHEGRVVDRTSRRSTVSGRVLTSGRGRFHRRRG